METSDWKAEYQHVIGDTLGWINARSYKAHGILLSSMAISKDSNQPGERYFGLCQQVGLFNGKTESDRFRFWAEQMEMVREFAAAIPPGNTAADLASLVTFTTEGAEKIREVAVRDRCAVLFSTAREAHRGEDGLLRCAACGLHKPQGPIAGDIVQLHHLDPISKASKEGRLVNLAEAKTLLITLCPNCHFVSHAREGSGLFELEELRELNR